jgi:heme/copper-type cytochrome/quinol oxidase subunit 2
MVLAASQAFVKTFGLIVTFGGIGVVVNVIVVYILVQVRGERRQNEEYLASRRPPGSSG